MSLKTIVTFDKFSWETGKQLLDAEVSLGSADKSSSCRVTIADPMHFIAAAIINHSQMGGGIQALPDTNKTPTPTIPGAKPETGGNTSVTAVPAGNGTVARGANFDAVTLAALDTVAFKETSSPNSLSAYYANNGIKGSLGQFTDADILAGGGFPASAGTRYNVGRYQFNRGDWQDAKRKFRAITGYSPRDQDLVALYKLQYGDRGWKELRAGDIEAFLKKAGKEWASVPGSPYGQVQAGVTKQIYLDYYEQRLAFHQAATGNKPAVVKTTPAVKPAAPNAVSKPLAPASVPLSQEQPVIKGSVMTIQIGSTFYEFMHQGTEMSDAGITILVGQGIRWIMSRRKRSATYKDISLKQLAEKVAKEHKVALDYQATNDPQYSHVDQSGISDYQLLLRETEANGLLMTETKTTIVIKERQQLADSKLVLSRGVNLISYKITDRAMGGSDDEISKLLPQTAKTIIDPVSGKAQSIIKDVDRNADAAKPTGKSKPLTSGTLKAGEVTQIKERAATKRIAGLPSVFVIPLTEDTLTIEPISTAVTKGLPGVLDRLWVVKKVTHKVADNTTTLDMVSPVEVLDINPTPVIPGAKPEPTTSGNVNSKGWIYHCSGTVTSAFGMRVHPVTGVRRLHGGIDVANSINTPIYAVQSGVVSYVGDRGAGGGNQVQVKHIGEYSAYESIYLHNTSVIVSVGQKVGQGQQIAFMGNTGIGTGSHSHFTIKKDGTAFDAKTIWTKLGIGNRVNAKEVV